jgi:hypothetical protein
MLAKGKVPAGVPTGGTDKDRVGVSITAFVSSGAATSAAVLVTVDSVFPRAARAALSSSRALLAMSRIMSSVMLQTPGSDQRWNTLLKSMLSLAGRIAEGQRPCMKAGAGAQSCSLAHRTMGSLTFAL